MILETIKKITTVKKMPRFIAHYMILIKLVFRPKVKNSGIIHNSRDIFMPNEKKLTKILKGQ